MNWLTPLCQEILKLKSFSRDHRDTVILWASELAGICDSFVPDAPQPILGSDPAEGTIELSWLWQRQQRAIGVTVEQGDLRASVTMIDRGDTHVTLRPSHDQLKTSVRSFFEEWVPRG